MFIVVVVQRGLGAYVGTTETYDEAKQLADDLAEEIMYYEGDDDISIWGPGEEGRLLTPYEYSVPDSVLYPEEEEEVNP